MATTKVIIKILDVLKKALAYGLCILLKKKVGKYENSHIVHALNIHFSKWFRICSWGLLRTCCFMYVGLLIFEESKDT